MDRMNASFKRFCLIPFICALAWTFTNSLAWADMPRASSVEQVAIAFYKTGGTMPNFTSWAQEMKGERKKDEPENPLFKKNEMPESERLQAAYETYDPSKDRIIIKTQAKVVVGENDGGPLMAIEFARGHLDYFPFEFRDQVIAVIPRDMQTHLQPKLTEDEAVILQKGLDRADYAIVTFELRPSEADTRAPHMLDGVEQWYFMTDIASVSVWNKREALLWEYHAPWSSLDKIPDKLDAAIPAEPPPAALGIAPQPTP